MILQKRGFSSFTLHLLAMVLMVIDHIGVTFYPDQLWLRYIGRLSFPIFAFAIVQGFHHTHSFKKYMLRLFILAIITDIPYNLMVNGNLEWVPFKNVIWTFLLSLTALYLIHKIKIKFSKYLGWTLNIIIILFTCILASILDTDYHDLGVLMVLTFYFFPNTSHWGKLGQFLSFAIINILFTNIESMMSVGLDRWLLLWNIYHWQLISPQIWAIASLPIIWLYNQQRGHKSRLSQAISYLFYPVHMIILGLLAIIS